MEMLGREKRWKEGRLEGERGDKQDGIRDAGNGGRWRKRELERGKGRIGNRKEERRGKESEKIEGGKGEKGEEHGEERKW